MGMGRMTRGPESNDMIAVTIGVPTYRRPELLEALLRTLVQDAGPDQAPIPLRSVI